MTDESKFILEKLDTMDGKLDKKLDVMFKKFDVLHESNIRHDEKIKLLWRVFIVTPISIIIGVTTFIFKRKLGG